jgi:hypothetical protein
VSVCTNTAKGHSPAVGGGGEFGLPRGGCKPQQQPNQERAPAEIAPTNAQYKCTPLIRPKSANRAETPELSRHDNNNNNVRYQYTIPTFVKRDRESISSKYGACDTNRCKRFQGRPVTVLGHGLFGDIHKPHRAQLCTKRVYVFELGQPPPPVANDIATDFYRLTAGPFEKDPLKWGESRRSSR